MSLDQLIERLYGALLTGNRPAARAIVGECELAGYSPEDTVADVYWSVHERLEREFREDTLTRLQHQMATRLLRVLVDQAAGRFSFPGGAGRRVFAVSGPTEADELSGQMATDLLEAAGFEVAFAGGNIATDEVLARVQGDRPDVLLLFGSGPSDLPAIREVIDTVDEIGACKDVQIVVGGGVFNRAPGLAEEIGADLWSEHPLDLVDIMLDEPERKATPDQRTVGAKAPSQPKRSRKTAA
jgi:methanogenic corrinoid protein MtbC1